MPTSGKDLVKWLRGGCKRRKRKPLEAQKRRLPNHKELKKGTEYALKKFLKGAE